MSEQSGQMNPQCKLESRLYSKVEMQSFAGTRNNMQFSYDESTFNVLISAGKFTVLVLASNKMFNIASDF